VRQKASARPAVGRAERPIAEPAKPPVVGIVGGLASGKSTVAKLLAERGARVVDADAIGHHVLDRKPVKEAVKDAFGEDVFDTAGRVSHRKLAEAVFGRATQVEKLNSIVHPLIVEEIRREVARFREDKALPLVVLDAALLVETGLDKELCQALVFVDAPRRVRVARAERGRGMNAKQFHRREQAQLPEEVKRRRAEYVVSNGGALQDLANQVEGLWPELCRRGKGRTRRQPDEEE